MRNEWACNRWANTPFDEAQSITIAQDAPFAGRDVALLIAHELGHVMGYEHDDSRPNIMTSTWGTNAWELP